MKKKLLLIVSMLAVTFALAGCGAAKKTVEFDYTNEELAQMVQDKSDEYMYYVSIDEFYNYVTDPDNTADIDESEVDAIQAFSKLEDECGEFVEYTGEYEAEVSDDTVIVSIFAKCADEEAEIKAIFISNLEEYNFQKYLFTSQGYDEATADEALKANGIYPYKISEFEISANQTFGAKMKAAGTNTIIGMGIVFIVLIFISFIISLLKYVPMLFDKETRAARKAEKAKNAADGSEDDKSSKEETKSEPAQSGAIVDIVNTETGESAMDDSQLVAVISAAITAYEGQSVVIYPSNDKLVARPIRRIKR
ncbi:MAG: OadG family transporter subunit [Coprococcus sp.]